LYLDHGDDDRMWCMCAALVALENGLQVAFMAPTEILAEQHFFNIRRLLEQYLEAPGVEAVGASLVGQVRTGFVDLDTLLGGLKRSDLILVAARLLFDIPLLGSLWLLLGALLVFIAANVTLGYTFSTLARTPQT
jgi:hypothetical protein